MAEWICRTLRDGGLEGEHAPALTINDTISCPLGSFVFDHILSQLASFIFCQKSQSNGIVLSPFMNNLLKSKGFVVAHTFSVAKILDCYTDPLGWRSKLVGSGSIRNLSSGSSLTVNICKNVKDLDELFSSILELGKELSGDGKGRFTVAIDSVQFNLQLSEKEKNDRAKVVLPFEHQGNGKTIQIYDGRKSLNDDKAEPQNNSVQKVDSNRGEIIYFRDSDDEMPDSDEDPDDDLDI
ncbi:UNVERIFIED_CONTAM: Elongator complex protein 5 [Sesamum radiatum]|uniref:Elongator complex protein 5 n=1 Tax=Sesamum radiatum TaxID=300843 RepID=A0AAW2P5X1_SESRA